MNSIIKEKVLVLKDGKWKQVGSFGHLKVNDVIKKFNSKEMWRITKPVYLQIVNGTPIRSAMVLPFKVYRND